MRAWLIPPGALLCFWFPQHPAEKKLWVMCRSISFVFLELPHNFLGCLQLLVRQERVDNCLSFSIPALSVTA